MAAVHPALEIPEILESILLSVDRQTLLIAAQRVCKAWHQQINCSPSLSRYLFLNVPISQTVADTNTGEYAFNPLLTRAFPRFFDGIADREEKSEESVQENFDPTWLFINTKLYMAAELCGEEEKSPFLRKDASWMRMHVTDPPTTTVLTHSKSGGQCGRSSRLETQTYHQGLRMAEFYSIILLWVCDDGDCGVQITWPKHRHIVYEASVGYSSDLWDKEPWKVQQVKTQLLLNLAHGSGCEDDSASDVLLYWCGLKFFELNSNEPQKEDSENIAISA